MDTGFRKSQQTRQRIMDGYLDMMREKRWDKTTVRELCGKLHISRGTFYQYYTDIYDLVEQAEDQLLQLLRNGYKQLTGRGGGYGVSSFFDTADSLPCPAQFVYWFQFCRQHEQSIGPLLSPGGEPSFRNKVKAIIQQQVALVMERDNMPDDSIRQYFLEAMTELHILGAQAWLSAPSDCRPDPQLLLHPINMVRVGGCYAHYNGFYGSSSLQQLLTRGQISVV